MSQFRLKITDPINVSKEVVEEKERCGHFIHGATLLLYLKVTGVTYQFNY
jgi:hypothetical protein